MLRDMPDQRSPHEQSPRAPHAAPAGGTHASAVARLACPAELDLASAGGLVDDLDDLVALGYRHVRFELDRLRFCDVVGLRALLSAKERVERAGGTVELTGHSCSTLALLQRVFGLSPQLEPSGGGPAAG